MLKRLIYIGLSVLMLNNIAYGQGYVDQEKVAPLLNSQNSDTDIDDIPEVKWVEYNYVDKYPNDGRGVWTELKDYLDSLPGTQRGLRLEIVELANRITSDKMKMGMKLLIPASFPDDYRAYAPYPRHYTAARGLPKLFIIDKYTQTFAAYEYGELVRWGLVSTGSTNDKTPSGRYNFNWKSEFRISSASPPGETWELPYMFNFDAGVGLHVHQYVLPINKPVSHGCVRVAMADAKWNFDWANGWTKENGRLVKNGTPVLVINDNPIADARHWKQDALGYVQSEVSLPPNPEFIPEATYAQNASNWRSGR